MCCPTTLWSPVKKILLQRAFSFDTQKLLTLLYAVCCALLCQKSIHIHVAYCVELWILPFKVSPLRRHDWHLNISFSFPAKYIGCYVDDTQKRALRGVSFFDYKKMTVFRCQDNCAERYDGGRDNKNTPPVDIPLFSSSNPHRPRFKVTLTKASIVNLKTDDTSLFMVFTTYWPTQYINTSLCLSTVCESLYITSIHITMTTKLITCDNEDNVTWCKAPLASHFIIVLLLSKYIKYTKAKSKSVAPLSTLLYVGLLMVWGCFS